MTVAEDKTHALIGQNYTTPDLVAKVTGKAKYAEDFRTDGMLFAKLLLSPMPHARVVRIDASAALAMPGVKAILTADDLPAPADIVTDLGQTIKANPKGERALTNEPLYHGEPVLAVAAVDEHTAAEAIEKIQVEFEPLPFVVDPLVSLRPGGPNPRLDGNVWGRPAAPPGPAGGRGAPPAPLEVQELKWTEADFAGYSEGHLPMGKTPPDEWTYGDLEAGFKNAALVLDESFVTPNSYHQTLESRTAMAYWQNGKLYMHTGTQSAVQTVASISRWLRLDPADVVLITEYTGGGFGSKATGAISCMIPALLSKKANAPVMMRISREEEHSIGGLRPGLHGRMKVGFAKDGRITAVDMFTICDTGPYEAAGDGGQSGRIVSLMYQPLAMRWRGVTILTNTPPRRAQSQPGGLQGIMLMEPVLAKAARKLAIDQVAIRRLNAPEGKAPVGPANPQGKRPYATSAFIKEALDRGAELFRWDERKALSGKRQGSKVRGVGVAVSTFVAGSTGFDGLFVIKPDGRMYIQSGIGNHGTESVSDVHRVAAEMMGMPWERCEITWGTTSKNLPWTCVSGGSQTTHAMTRAAHAAASDAVQKAQEIAAKTLGGNAADYKVANERVSGNGRSMTLAQVAQKAIELGGLYDGHELPKDINKVTVTSATALAGQGLMGVARDKYPHDGGSYSYVAGFAEVEVDVETGKYQILDYLAVADVGTIIHPHALGGQILGRSMLGIGHAIGQKTVYDQHYGVSLAKRFYQNRPPTILDAPVRMQWAALDIPDPETPVGARGIGEPPVGAGACAVLNALSAAIGDEVFQRAPVNADTILASLEAGRPMQEPLTAHI
jgi:xanthine dehydrogenase molybdenum-binding subunit